MVSKERLWDCGGDVGSVGSNNDVVKGRRKNEWGLTTIGLLYVCG